MRILLVDDDELLAEVIKKNLSEKHYAVDVAADGEAGWEYATTFAYDALVLDVLLPKLDGVTLCRRLRDSGHRLPILLLTARDSSTDKVKGLDAGADDYVVKPFDVEELAARIRALLRRESQSLPPVLRWGNLTLNPSTCEVAYGSQPLHLTPKEYALLELFLRHRQRVFSPGAIIDHLWAAEEIPGEEAVRTHLKGLRHKLKAAGAPPDLIETVYGLGYRLKVPPIEPASPPEVAATLSEPQNRQANYFAALTGAWEQSKEKIFRRLAVLEQAATALQEDSLSDALQQQAAQEAHSLVGTLGTFGFAGGARLARELEHLLQEPVPLETQQAPSFGTLVANLRQEMEGTPSNVVERGVSSLPIVQGGGERKGMPDFRQGVFVPSEAPLLLAIHQEGKWTQQLGEAATARGIRTAFATALSQAREWLAQARPDAVLLQISWAGEVTSPSECLALLEELAQQTPPLPVLVVAEGDNLTNRLEVLRRGGQSFLAQPVAPLQALDSVLQLLRGKPSETKVMVVDDDPQLLESLQTLLKPWGFKLITLDEPQQFWAILQAVNPDLLVLDVEMPQVSGLELCQVLRSDPHWERLPVLFLTAYGDAQTQEQAFALGADDFVSKPVTGAELANRILNRLERVRVLKSRNRLHARGNSNADDG